MAVISVKPIKVTTWSFYWVRQVDPDVWVSKKEVQ